MALALDPSTHYKTGLIRCITKRTGKLHVRGYIDESLLYKVERSGLEHFIITDRLKIENENELINNLTGGRKFLGLEDPDIWLDEESQRLHVYYTIPFLDENRKKTETYLGHAEGNDLDSLKMTAPLISPDAQISRAKEVSIAPKNSRGVRLNLIESRERNDTIDYSTVRVAVAPNPSDNWSLGNLVFHPKTNGYDWCSGHASPGPMFSKNFIDVGKNKVLAILNGREKEVRKNGKAYYGMFSVGLMIYNFEEGKIEWTSKQPLIKDPNAKTITFASQFVQTNANEGILYAHIDDSFVRAYTLRADGLRSLLP